MTKNTNNQQGAPEVRFEQLPLNQLSLNDYNARHFEENMTVQRRARFAELVDSVSVKGIKVPLLVRPLPDADRFEVIAGERRYRAALQVCNILGQHPEQYLVPCMVYDVDEVEAFDTMLIENLQREDLTPFETAQAFQAYLQRHGNTPDSVTELSARTGIPPHAIRRQVRILELPPEVLVSWKAGSLTQSHAELLTRVGDRDQIIELVTNCLRLKLTVRELAERIGSISLDLERAAFDKSECQTCPYNTSVQSSLFADLTPAGKCGNAACFERLQRAYFTANWERSKACERFGTLGYRFGHRLPQEHRLLPPPAQTSGRCLECDQFVSVLRLTGAIISGYERTCLGPRACFEPLYCEAPETQVLETAMPKQEQNEQPGEQLQDPPPPAKEPASKPAKAKGTPPAETGPVFSLLRGEKFRELFFKEAIPDAVMGTPNASPRVKPFLVLAMALASTAARTRLCVALGIEQSSKQEQLAEKIFEIPADDVLDELQAMALAQVMDSSTTPAVRRLVAERFNVDLAKEWTIGKEYLEALDKSEIVRIGEEPGVQIWQDEQVKAYKQQHFKGKALMALKKEDLVDLILKSSAELVGRVPAEVLGERKG
ncbi:MAG: hypothetical protein A2075_09220 [Geobacteraceae bacterium GWC2_58_44]|nr:MAG: hypothetical protein A2075_09220 [Geobacteraceae bacterium GWC2_58_44]HBG07693.1 hypothetical protein [Geobacter sp.]